MKIITGAILLIEYWLGKTKKVKSNSIIEIILTALTLIIVWGFAAALILKETWRNKK